MAQKNKFINRILDGIDASNVTLRNVLDTLNTASSVFATGSPYGIITNLEGTGAAARRAMRNVSFYAPERPYMDTDINNRGDFDVVRIGSTEEQVSRLDGFELDS
jgi:hypothetical protein